MTKKELMHKVYLLAIETKLITSDLKETTYSRYMWGKERKERVKSFYNYLLKKVNA